MTKMVLEIWKQTHRKGYEVSSLGRVRSLDRVIVDKRGVKKKLKGRVLKPGKIERDNGKGYYLFVQITSGVSSLVHRLVAEAFLENSENKPEVNHKDGDKTNNRLDNLEWATHQENCDHASQIGLASGGSLPGESNPYSTLTETKVRALRRLFATGEFSKAHLARLFKVSHGAISNVIKRRSWRHIDDT